MKLLCGVYIPPFAVYLEGHGDLVRRSIMGISRATFWFRGVINVLTKSPDPPSSGH